MRGLQRAITKGTWLFAFLCMIEIDNRVLEAVIAVALTEGMMAIIDRLMEVFCEKKL